MASLNKVQLIGRVGKDPEIKNLGESKVAKFSLAISEKYKGEQKTEWQNIVIWNKLADVVQRFVKKGDLLYLEGKIQTRSWDQDGVKRYSTEIVVYSMQMLGSKSSHVAEEHHNTEASAPTLDDLPF
jgi:single-strand DNA-binding protein